MRDKPDKTMVKCTDYYGGMSLVIFLIAMLWLDSSHKGSDWIFVLHLLVGLSLCLWALFYFYKFGRARDEDAPTSESLTSEERP